MLSISRLVMVFFCSYTNSNVARQILHKRVLSVHWLGNHSAIPYKYLRVFTNWNICWGQGLFVQRPIRGQQGLYHKREYNSCELHSRGRFRVIFQIWKHQKLLWQLNLCKMPSTRLLTCSGLAFLPHAIMLGFHIFLKTFENLPSSIKIAFSVWWFLGCQCSSADRPLCWFREHHSRINGCGRNY